MSQLAILGGSRVRQQPWPAWPQFNERDRERLMGVLESRNWGGFPFPNRYSAEFAGKFAALHGARYGCTVVNGTAAITLALRAAGVKFGDEVIVPAYTWDGTATAALDAGATPVFADIDPDTYCLDVEAVRAAITPRTRAIIPVHLAMRFTEMDALIGLAREKDLLIVEDCAHAHGGQYKGRGAGAMGDLGTFSMQSSKLMTSGEGGAILTSRLDCFEAVQSLVNCGRASETDQFKQRPTGGNYRLSELQAALLMGQLEMLGELAATRSRNARRLSEGLAQIPGVRPLPPQAGITGEAIYCYVFQYRPAGPRVPRDLFVAALDAEGVPSDGRFYEPVYRSDLFRPGAEIFPQLAYGRERAVDYRRDFACPVAERAAYEEAVWLPQFVLLGGEKDVDDILKAVEKVAARLDSLAGADPALAGVKALSRADRPKIEKKNY
jgi:dTDP-4-amino-4,6-dideoxygalactose transaminase